MSDLGTSDLGQGRDVIVVKLSVAASQFAPVMPKENSTHTKTLHGKPLNGKSCDV